MIGVLSVREISLIEKLDFDLIFSTIYLNNLEWPVLVLDPLFNFKTIDLVKNFLEFHSDKLKRVNPN